MTHTDYARSARREGKIRLHGPEAFAGMRKAGRLAAGRSTCCPHVKPGVTTERLDDLVFEFAMDHGAMPAPLNYRGYTKSICTSINHVVCHGIPGAEAAARRRHPQHRRDADRRRLARRHQPHVCASARSRARAERLIEVTYEALMRGIAAVKPGDTTGDIGQPSRPIAEAERCCVVRDFCGHGLGRVFHDRPNILHYGEPGEGVVLKPGMLFTIEPMINLGKPHVKMLADGWTAVTRDRELSAQFEHTVGVTEDGCEVFTLSPGRPPPAALHGA